MAKKGSFDNSLVRCSSETGSCADPHDADNRYRWTAAGTTFNGTVARIFLQQLNNRCIGDVFQDCTSGGDSDCEAALGLGEECGFAGYRDWRLPNVTELQSIVNYGTFTPATYSQFATNSSSSCDIPAGDADLCSCTDASDPYWSSTTRQSSTANAWDVVFTTGAAGVTVKTGSRRARAVRGGL